MQQLKSQNYKTMQTQDPQQQLSTQQIEYSRTIVPASMRSAYWKYFGFPSDNANQILTRQKIICTLCNTAIAYNKNTSNLRTHLISRHPEMLHELQQAAAAASSTRPLRRKRKQQSELSTELGEDVDEDVTVAQKYARFSDNCDSLLVVADEEQSEFVDLTGTALKAQSLIEVDKQQKDLEGVLTHTADEHSQHSNSTMLLPNTTDSVDYNDFVDASEVDDVAQGVADVSVPAPDALDVAQPYSYVDILTPVESRRLMTQRHGAPGLDLQAEMLVLDLLPINTLGGRGFQQLLLQQCGDTVNTTAVASQICTLYTRMQARLSSHIEQLAQNAPYALSMETYWNIENVHILCIYFNFFNTVCHQLENVLYLSASCKDLNLSNCLQNLDLDNCAAIIVRSEELHSLIADFAAVQAIPIFECLEAVLTRCLKRIFVLPSIKASYEQVCSVIADAWQVDERFLNMPDLHVNCPWSKLNLLQYAVDHDVLSDLQAANKQSLSAADMRQFVDYISPLKITLDTIAAEPLPVCTLIRPLIVKLFEEHFATYNSQTAHMQQVADIIETELTDSIINNQYLHEATFFDARFQRDFIGKLESNRVQLQSAICQRYKRLIELTNVTPKSHIKMERDLRVESTNGDGSGNRRSGLKSFFTRINNGAHASCRPATQPTQKSNIDLEFERYMCEPTLDLEQCPISWWQEHAYRYRQLYKIASNYLCVPCCVNSWFRYDANERLAWRNKRFILRQQFSQQQQHEQRRHNQLPHQSAALAETCLWYLHYNKLFYDKLNEEA